MSVLLVRAPAVFARARAVRLDQLGRSIAAARRGETRAMILRDEDGDHHVHVASGPGDGPLAAIVPFDEDFTVRIAACARLYRLIRGRRAGPPPAPWRLTAQQRAHLADALRALDGRIAGASQREIARVIFRRSIEGRAWHGSDLHARTKRALAMGRTLMRGGYRNLLAAPSRAHDLRLGAGDADSPS